MPPNILQLEDMNSHNKSTNIKYVNVLSYHIDIKWLLSYTSHTQHQNLFLKLTHTSFFNFPQLGNVWFRSSGNVPGFCTSLKTICPPGCNKTWMVAIVEAKCIVAWMTLVAKMAVISWLLKPSGAKKCWWLNGFGQLRSSAQQTKIGIFIESKICILCIYYVYKYCVCIKLSDKHNLSGATN